MFFDAAPATLWSRYWTRSSFLPIFSTLHTLCRFSYTSPAINHHQSSIIVVILSSCHPIH
ncbi:hypothetical protein COCCADRAFT_91663 [Bipolaris zeicola 26-R-13]|uniref:Uncharacterized protein n=1 Tax=Cochliobolus carbonum (strain 26-R-13) TaxID=930089 RepID=W6YBX3_COCC2|nr:uncharacterized protein COCCADRAFT_91663 [Bipolaris zeicola 26-R-13]EUC35120.1 hypothetical protein COCCADRAFT_91663 [Bipolaris zeicola 26-R-13]